MILGYTKEKLASKSAIKTAEEIFHQPNMWEETFQIVKKSSEIQSLVNQYLIDKDATIVFAGAGSSEFVGNIAKAIVTQYAKCKVLSIPTTDIITNLGNYSKSEEKTLMISFGRSGSSPESIGAIDVANKFYDSVVHLAITCNKDGDLSNYAKSNKNGFSVVLPDKTNDLGFAMTSSFTSMLLAAILLFNKKISLDEIKGLNELTQSLLDNNYSDIEKIVKEFDFERIVYIGSGDIREVGKEANLKMLELTRGEVVGIYDSCLGFRHGPKSFLNKKTLVVVFMSNNENVNKYEVDLINEIVKENKHGQLLVADSSGGISLVKTNTEMMNINKSINSDLVAMYYTVVGQLLSFYGSIDRNITTDNPFPEGNLNRVVHGVKMHY